MTFLSSRAGKDLDDDRIPIFHGFDNLYFRHFFHLSILGKLVKARI